MAIWEPSVVGRTLMRSVAYIEHGRGLRDVDGPRINCGVHRRSPYFYKHDVNNSGRSAHQILTFTSHIWRGKGELVSNTIPTLPVCEGTEDTLHRAKRKTYYYGALAARTCTLLSCSARYLVSLPCYTIVVHQYVTYVLPESQDISRFLRLCIFRSSET